MREDGASETGTGPSLARTGPQSVPAVRAVARRRAGGAIARAGGFNRVLQWCIRLHLSLQHSVPIGVPNSRMELCHLKLCHVVCFNRSRPHKRFRGCGITREPVTPVLFLQRRSKRH